MLKANAGLETLTDEESARLHFLLVMTLGCFENVYFQRDLGLVNTAVIEGFERSHISVLTSKSDRAWWTKSKEIFNSRFVTRVEELLKRGAPKNLHPTFRADRNNSHNNEH